MSAFFLSVGAAVGTVFVFGSLPFWLFLLAIAALVTVQVNEDNGDRAGVTLFLTAAAFAAFSDFNIFTYVYNNPAHSIWCLVKYLGIGFLLYAPFLKTSMVFSNALNQLQDYKTNFLKSKGLKSTIPVPQHLKKEYAEYLGRYGYKDLEHLEPEITQADFIRWGTFWIFSAPWTFLRDPIRKFGRLCYRFFSSTIAWIGRWWFKFEYNDLPSVEVEKENVAPPAPAATPEPEKKS